VYALFVDVVEHERVVLDVLDDLIHTSRVIGALFQLSSAS
jgi:hypothetical protein